MSNRKIMIGFKADTEVKDELDKIADLEDRSVSYIVNKFVVPTKTIKIINIGTIYSLTLKTPLTLVKKTIVVRIANIIFPITLCIPNSCSKYAPKPAIII